MYHSNVNIHNCLEILCILPVWDIQQEDIPNVIQRPHCPNPYLHLTIPTELPYAADAEMSLTFDELEVYLLLTYSILALLLNASILGPPFAVPEGTTYRGKTTSLCKRSLNFRGDSASRALFIITKQAEGERVTIAAHPTTFCTLAQPTVFTKLFSKMIFGQTS